MSKVVVIYHSGYGHTQVVAKAVAKGADAAIIAIDAEGNLPEGAWDQLAAADAIIFGTPTYMGNVSWQFKKFAEATSKIWYTQGWKNKLFAGFTNSASMNGDKANTMNGLFTLAMQHGGIWVGLGILPSSSKAAARNDPNYLGAYAGALVQSPTDASALEIPQGDLDTARALGERVALIAAKLA
jgi:NAD(P)H dehydrogenase (quinone)